MNTISLEKIGFYTLSNKRAKDCCQMNENGFRSALQRCELILTDRCNFACPYCRHTNSKDMPFKDAQNIVNLWAKEGLQNIRFSGGEPTLYPQLKELVKQAKSKGIKRIAISTNGSSSLEYYKELIDAGVNDFSISLDACCAEDGDKMAGGKKNSWNVVVANIKALSQLSYLTVGVVLTDDNMDKVNEIITFADSLGISDIRIIPAAQHSSYLQNVKVDKALLDKYPILNYRITNIQNNLPVRGLSSQDSSHCGLVIDDMAVMGDSHYPCIIYLREKGSPIGKVGPNMRQEREEWHKNHSTHDDVICSQNCLDVCIHYNNVFNSFCSKKE